MNRHAELLFTSAEVLAADFRFRIVDAGIFVWQLDGGKSHMLTVRPYKEVVQFPETQR